jgi:hypothetical protein
VISPDPLPSPSTPAPDPARAAEPLAGGEASAEIVVEDAGTDDESGESQGSDGAPLPLVSTLESLLFVSDEPVEPTRLAQALHCSLADVQTHVTQ